MSTFFKKTILYLLLLTILFPICSDAQIDLKDIYYLRPLPDNSFFIVTIDNNKKLRGKFDENFLLKEYPLERFSSLSFKNSPAQYNALFYLLQLSDLFDKKSTLAASPLETNYYLSYQPYNLLFIAKGKPDEKKLTAFIRKYINFKKACFSNILKLEYIRENKDGIKISGADFILKKEIKIPEKSDSKSSAELAESGKINNDSSSIFGEEKIRLRWCECEGFFMLTDGAEELLPKLIERQLQTKKVVWMDNLIVPNTDFCQVYNAKFSEDDVFLFIKPATLVETVSRQIVSDEILIQKSVEDSSLPEFIKLTKMQKNFINGLDYFGCGMNFSNDDIKINSFLKLDTYTDEKPLTHILSFTNKAELKTAPKFPIEDGYYATLNLNIASKKSYIMEYLKKNAPQIFEIVSTIFMNVKLNLGVDIEKEIIGNLIGEISILSLPKNNGKPNNREACILEISNSGSIPGTIEKLKSIPIIGGIGSSEKKTINDMDLFSFSALQTKDSGTSISTILTIGITKEFAIIAQNEEDAIYVQELLTNPNAKAKTQNETSQKFSISKTEASEKSGKISLGNNGFSEFVSELIADNRDAGKSKALLYNDKLEASLSSQDGYIQIQIDIRK